MQSIIKPGPPRGGAGGQMPRGPATFRGPAGPTVNIVNMRYERAYIRGPYMRGPVTALPRGPDFHSVALNKTSVIILY